MTDALIKPLVWTPFVYMLLFNFFSELNFCYWSKLNVTMSNLL